MKPQRVSTQQSIQLNQIKKILILGNQLSLLSSKKDLKRKSSLKKNFSTAKYS